MGAGQPGHLVGSRFLRLCKALAVVSQCRFQLAVQNGLQLPQGCGRSTLQHLHEVKTRGVQALGSVVAQGLQC